MRKLTAAILAIAIGTTLAMMSGTTGLHAQEARAQYPYYTTGATTEAENEDRIDYVGSILQDRRSDRREATRQVDDLTQKINELKERREQARARRAAIIDDISRNRFLLQSLQRMRGYVVHAFACRTGESTNNYEAHGDHPNGEQVHGGYQALISTWAKAYGYTDPHEAPWFVQDRWYVDMLEAGRGGEFAAAGC